MRKSIETYWLCGVYLQSPDYYLDSKNYSVTVLPPTPVLVKNGRIIKPQITRPCSWRQGVDIYYNTDWWYRGDIGGTSNTRGTVETTYTVEPLGCIENETKIWGDLPKSKEVSRLKKIADVRTPLLKEPQYHNSVRSVKSMDRYLRKTKQESLDLYNSLLEEVKDKLELIDRINKKLLRW